MKTYTFWVTLFQCRIVVNAAHKWDAVQYAKKQLNLTANDSIICLGINL